MTRHNTLYLIYCDVNCIGQGESQSYDVNIFFFSGRAGVEGEELEGYDEDVARADVSVGNLPRERSGYQATSQEPGGGGSDWTA